MTGSRPQLYNGIILLLTFFGCRLVWGTYQSIRVYQDVWAAIQSPGILISVANSTMSATEKSVSADAEIMRFGEEGFVPVWLASTYLASNVVLNTLNFYWFGKMIETVRKRFRPKEKSAIKMDGGHTSDERARAGIDEDGHKVLTAEKNEVRRRRG